MIINLSKQTPEIKDKITAEVGSPFSLLERQQLKGCTSGKLEITGQSIDIHNLIIFSQGPNLCTLELRPDGIIVRIQVGLEIYGLLMPYYKLKIYKGSAEEYALHRDHYYVKLKADTSQKHAFIKKIRQQKLEHWSTEGLWP